MSQDDVTSEEEVELIDSSEETQNVGEEDNSLSESKKNQSNFKKLAKKLKEERRERERLQAELRKLKSEDEDLDDSFEDDEDLDGLDSTKPFSDIRSELWFVKNKDAEEYREKMAELVEDNQARAKLPLSDLLALAKARFPKSTTKKTFDITSIRSTPAKDISIDTSKMSEEEIMKLPPDVYKKLFLKK
jgi:septal ring factor EnvC (AmiA/AmiB activator)